MGKKTLEPLFTKGLSKGLRLKFKTFVINVWPKFWHRFNGIHKEFKTGHRLKKGHNFKTGR